MTAGEKRPRRPRPAPRPRPAKVSTDAIDNAPVPIGRPLQAADVTRLQRTAGNQVTVAAVQRYRPGGGPIKYPRSGRPTHGPDVRAALRAELPGLFAGLTEAQLNRWQQVVDYYVIKRHIDRERQELVDSYAGYYGRQTYESAPGYKQEMRKLETGAPTHPPGGDRLVVDVNQLLADDAKAEPQWDVTAEKAFRTWALSELAKSPPSFDMYPDYDDQVITRRTWVGSFTTKGMITLSDLHNQFRDQYSAQVTNRDDWQKLRGAFADTTAVFTEALALHHERSDINKRNEGVFGIDIVRNIIETIGKGDQNYPTIHIWDEPKKLLARIGPLLADQKFEMVVPLLSMAEMSTAAAANRIYSYDNRVESGARVGVKWLNRIKTVGSVAASIAAGPLGLTGAALVGGAYTFVQEGAQNATAYALGQRKDLGLGSLVKQAGVSTLLGMVGGALQSEFKAAMSAKIAVLMKSSTNATREWATSAAAAALSSEYTTAAQVVLDRVIDGKPIPSASELADMVVTNALQSGVQDALTSPMAGRIKREFDAWKAGKAPAATPSAMSPVEVARMPEDVVRRMFTEAGSWERLQTELNAGSGLAQGMTVPERMAVLDRFEASRAALAGEVGSMFGGSTLVLDTAAGKAVEVRFLGDGAETKAAEARAYLDVKHPGWATETGLTVETTTAKPESIGVAAALEVSTPEGRMFAQQLIPMFEHWNGGRTQAERLALLAGQVNAYLDQFHIPPVLLDAPKSGRGGEFDMLNWQIEIGTAALSGDTQTPEQFAYVCGLAMHEAVHVRQVFRAARTSPSLAQGRIDKGAYAAATEMNAGTRPGESLDPASVAWAEGGEMAQAFWGSGAAHRSQVYTNLDQTTADFLKAQVDAGKLKGQARNSPDRAAAAKALIAAKTSFERAHDIYMALPEEWPAWKTGKETEAAVQERIHLTDQLALAEEAEKAAFERYQRAENKAIDAALDPTKATQEQKESFDRAIEGQKKAIEAVRALRSKIAKLTIAASATAGKP